VFESRDLTEDAATCIALHVVCSKLASNRAALFINGGLDTDGVPHTAHLTPVYLYDFMRCWQMTNRQKSQGALHLEFSLPFILTFLLLGSLFSPSMCFSSCISQIQDFISYITRTVVNVMGLEGALFAQKPLNLPSGGPTLQIFEHTIRLPVPL